MSDDCISRQEAIDAVIDLCKYYTPTKSVNHPHMDFVIEALQDLPSVTPKPVECDDCISRQQVLDFFKDDVYVCNEVMNMAPVTPKPIITNKSAVFWLENITEKYLKGDTFEDRQMKKSINKAIKALSKEPKIGHWIAEENEEMETIGYYCSECDLPMETENQTRFCPNCGAKMEVSDGTEI